MVNQHPLNKEGKKMNETNSTNENNVGQKKEWKTPKLQYRALQDVCLGGANHMSSDTTTSSGITYKPS